MYASLSPRQRMLLRARGLQLRSYLYSTCHPTPPGLGPDFSCDLYTFGLPLTSVVVEAIIGLHTPVTKQTAHGHDNLIMCDTNLNRDLTMKSKLPSRKVLHVILCATAEYAWEIQVYRPQRRPMMSPQTLDSYNEESQELKPPD